MLPALLDPRPALYLSSSSQKLEWTQLVVATEGRRETALGSWGVGWAAGGVGRGLGDPTPSRWSWALLSSECPFNPCCFRLVYRACDSEMKGKAISHF